MERPFKWCLVSGLVGAWWLTSSATTIGQVPRYQPARPTVSPYLNLFREDAGVLPNYHALVRPLQYQIEYNQAQQRINQQQAQALQQLQMNVQRIEQQAFGPVVAPTGQGSWFGRPSSRSQFGNTSRYYSNTARGQRR